MANVQLGDRSTFSFVSGLWKGQRAPLQSACVLRSTNFRGDGSLDFASTAELQIESRHFDDRRLIPGDIIIERSGGGPKQPVGRVASFNPPDDRTYFTSNFTTALRVIDQGRFDPGFVELYLHALYLRGATAHLQRATTGIRNLDWSAYLQFEVPELPLALQREIVRTIGGVRSAYRTEEAIIDGCEELKKSTMEQLFRRGLKGEPTKETERGPIPQGWELVSIGEITVTTQYGLSLRGQKTGKYPILRMNCQERGKVHYRNLQFVDLDDGTFDTFRLRPGDLLFNRTNSIDLVGRMAIVEEDCPAVFASYLIRLSVDAQRCLPSYLNHFMNWPTTQTDIKGLASRAVGQANINATKLRTVLVPLPPLSEQEEIAEILDGVDRKAEAHRRRRIVLQDLFKALLEKLATGQIGQDQLVGERLSEAAE